MDYCSEVFPEQEDWNAALLGLRMLLLDLALPPVSSLEQPCTVQNMHLIPGGDLLNTHTHTSQSTSRIMEPLSRLTFHALRTY